MPGSPGAAEAPRASQSGPSDTTRPRGATEAVGRRSLLDAGIRARNRQALEVVPGDGRFGGGSVADNACDG